MRKFPILLACLGLALPLQAAKRVSIGQLDEVIAQGASKPDTDLAWQIGDVQLTERISATGLAKLLKALPGEKSRQALTAVADASQFLDLPVSELPKQSAPDLAEQRRIMGLAVGYVSKTIPQLPNFFATRDTTRFEDTPQYNTGFGTLVPYQPIHYAGQSQASVLYRNGREAVDTGSKKVKADQITGGLTTWGVFGPIMGTVLVDAARSKLAWSHWENGESGGVAVFGFSVPRESSHYEVNYCCVADESATAVAQLHPFQQIVGYHGEMGIDPKTGAIVRLKVEADLKPTDPVVRAAILVEYGTVEIGDRAYICPIRSISATIAQSVQSNMVYKFAEANRQQPLKTSLNDVAYVNYHVFRSDAKVLTADEAALVQGTQNQPSPKDEPEDASNSQPAQSGATANDNPAESETVKTNATEVPPVMTARAESTPATTVPAVVVSEDPEVSVTTAGTLPDAPLTAQPPGGTGSEFTLRTTSRLVDVAVVAYDAKERPVTGLKAKDFQIFDNGRQEKVQFFSKVGAESLPVAAPARDHNSSQPEYSNRATIPESPRNVEQSETTILLTDSSNVAFGDLSYTRTEMLRFLKNVPDDERIGLYVLRRYGFDVLLEPTADHALVAATLTKWMPKAQDLANAQAEEERNRAHFDWVHSISDLASLNGNVGGDADPASPLDPRLRTMGSNPARDVLSLFRGLARHLSAIPGHKSLVWIASDNVLADWSDQAAGTERQASPESTLAPGTDDALNDAHISIYPLDASQLEAGGISADLRERNIVPVGKTSRSPELAVLGDADPVMKPGRITAQMQQDVHPIQGIFRDLAEATGGRVFRRSGDIAGELDKVVADGRAAYSLSFTPDFPADNAYHHLTVKVVGRNDLKLRYRTGYLYGKEPATMKERFREAVWQPTDMSEVGVTATPERTVNFFELKLNIAATDLGMAQQNGRWVDKVDVFVVERDDSTMHAKLNGKRLGLNLKPATYQQLLHDGMAFEEHVALAETSSNLRILVVDENTGRMGSVTVPVKAMATFR